MNSLPGERGNEVDVAMTVNEKPAKYEVFATGFTSFASRFRVHPRLPFDIDHRTVTSSRLFGRRLVTAPASGLAVALCSAGRGTGSATPSIRQGSDVVNGLGWVPPARRSPSTTGTARRRPAASSASPASAAWWASIRTPSANASSERLVT